jgi:hypothetical protein
MKSGRLLKRRYKDGQPDPQEAGKKIKTISEFAAKIME